MSFVKNSVSSEAIVDTVFAIADKAKQAKDKYGDKAVINATIGSLYGEDGKLVALESFYKSFNHFDDRIKASYAKSFTGNDDYLAAVDKWLFKDIDFKLERKLVATAGGTGAVSIAISSLLDSGDTLIIPSLGWPSYRLMANMNNLDVTTYSMFKDDKFDLDNFKQVCLDVMAKQDRLLIIINDPCHNPTGYSMSLDEWQSVIDFINECSQKVPCTILNDIAYIDYAYNADKCKYLELFDQISDNVLLLIAFSISKSCTAYGLRCGCALMCGKDHQKVQEVFNVYEKMARALWSNVGNCVMHAFADVITNHQVTYAEELNRYVELLRQRSSIFVLEANECKLPIYPYKEGFFVTLNIPNAILDKYHEALMAENIFTVKVNNGIRVAICSLSIEKIKGLAYKMKVVLDNLD